MRVKVLSYAPRTEPIKYLPPRDLAFAPKPQVVKRWIKSVRPPPEKIASLFLQACADEDWAKVRGLYGTIDERFKKRNGGLKIISVGKPVREADRYAGWYVPFKVESRSGKIRKGRLAVKGGRIDSGF